jgi:hypothetical protein
MYLLSDYILQVQELVHDTAGIDFLPSELINWINNSRKRVALDFHNVRYFFQNASLIGGKEQYPITGGIYGLTIAAGGANYSSPVITIAPPASGITAQAQAVVSGGVITQINMTNWGTGYTSAPAVAVADPTGVGANLVAMSSYLLFDLLSLSPLWGTQRYTMGWLPFTPFQAFCRSNPTLQRQPGVWSLIQEANIAFVYPIPDQNYPVDIDGVGLPAPLVNTTDVDTQILDPQADCVQYYAAHLALLKMQNFDQADYYHKKYKTRQAEIGVTRYTRRIPNIYRNYFRRINRW